MGRPPLGRANLATLSSGVSFGLLSFGATAVLNVASSILVGRLFGVHVVGEFALAYAPTGALWVLSTVREQPALIRALAVLEARSPRVTGLSFAVGLFSTVLTLIVALIVAAISYFVYTDGLHKPGLIGPAMVSLGGYLLLTNACWNFDSVLIGFRAGRVLFWLRLHQATAYLVLVVIGAQLRRTVWVLVLASALSWLTPLVHRLLVLGRWMPWRVTRADLRGGLETLPELIRWGLKLTPGSLAQGASDEAATWTLGLVASVGAVGAFNRAWLVARRFFELNLRFAEILLPVLVERRSSGDTRGFNRALVDSLRYVTFVTLLPAATIGGAAPAVMSLFGPGFGRSAVTLALVMLLPWTLALSFILSQALLADDRPWAVTLSLVVRALFALPAIILLAIPFGITGAGIGILIGGVAQLTVISILSERHLGPALRAGLPGRQVIGAISAWAAGFAVARAVTDLIPGPGGAPVALLAGAIAYSAVLLGVGRLLERDRDRLVNLTSSLTRGRVTFAAPTNRATALLGALVWKLTVPAPESRAP
jgi:O-antigen/teichoic acid export membrane protein